MYDIQVRDVTLGVICLVQGNNSGSLCDFKEESNKESRDGWDRARDLNFFFFSYFSYTPTDFLNIIAEGCFCS